MHPDLEVMVLAGMDCAQDCVQQFHDKCRVSEQTRIPTMPKHGVMSPLLHAAQVLGRLSEQLLISEEIDAHLLVEEIGEFCEALYSRDEVKVLDALADIQYIVMGRAAKFDLPLGAAFLEVHRSNMTKEKQPDDPHAARVRSKGPNYQPPKLEELLEHFRQCQLNPHSFDNALSSTACSVCGITREAAMVEYDSGTQMCLEGK